MNKSDLTILLALAEVARKNGLINMDAFEVVGGAVRRAIEIQSLMGDRDILSIKVEGAEEKPADSGSSKKATSDVKAKAKAKVQTTVSASK